MPSLQLSDSSPRMIMLYMDPFYSKAQVTFLFIVYWNAMNGMTFYVWIKITSDIG